MTNHFSHNFFTQNPGLSKVNSSDQGLCACTLPKRCHLRISIRPEKIISGKALAKALQK
jgi:hypothetical protein